MAVLALATHYQFPWFSHDHDGLTCGKVASTEDFSSGDSSTLPWLKIKHMAYIPQQIKHISQTFVKVDPFLSTTECFILVQNPQLIKFFCDISFIQIRTIRKWLY